VEGLTDSAYRENNTVVTTDGSFDTYDNREATTATPIYAPSRQLRHTEDGGPVYAARSPILCNIVVTMRKASASKNGPDRILLLEALRHGQLTVALNMLDEGADPNVEDESGQTPLLEAVRRGQSTVALKMLNKGADPNKKNGSGQIPLLEAVRRGQSIVALKMQWLELKVDVNRIAY
jgi:ankyrin repeat protein